MSLAHPEEHINGHRPTAAGPSPTARTGGGESPCSWSIIAPPGQARRGRSVVRVSPCLFVSNRRFHVFGYSG
jgi:hypothetical protein